MENKLNAIQCGDIVRGLAGTPYSITNENVTRGLVTKVGGKEIYVKIIAHKEGCTGLHKVLAKHFEVIDHVKPFDRNAVMHIISTGDICGIFEYDLTGANLTGALLTGALLTGARLHCALMTGARLTGANLTGADLTGARLDGARLDGANLTGALMTGARLDDANLTDANLTGACLDSARLDGALMTGARLDGADLTRANLTGALMTGARLTGADLSGAVGLIDAAEYLRDHFEKTDKGYIVYKTFGGEYSPPKHWRIESGSVIEEVVNPNRTDTCGCGVNVAPLNWVKSQYSTTVWKCLIEWEWLPGVVVPYNTDGKIRCSRVRLLETVA